MRKYAQTHTPTKSKDDPCVCQSRGKHREREGRMPGRAGGREAGRKGRPFLLFTPDFTRRISGNFVLHVYE
jgi:hypothetical protein